MKKQTIKKDDQELLTRKEFREFTGKHEEFRNEFVKTKNEFFQRFQKIEHALEKQAVAIIKNNDDITIIKETIATKDDIQKILSAIDSFAQKSQDVERKAIVNTHRINEMESTISTLDKRVSALEATVK